MARDQGIIRFDSEGPAGRGLESICEITPDMVEEGSASELCHNYYTSPSGLLTAGVWKCRTTLTSGRSRRMPQWKPISTVGLAPRRTCPSRMRQTVT